MGGDVDGHVPARFGRMSHAGGHAHRHRGRNYGAPASIGMSMGGGVETKRVVGGSSDGHVRHMLSPAAALSSHPTTSSSPSTSVVVVSPVLSRIPSHTRSVLRREHPGNSFDAWRVAWRRRMDAGSRPHTQPGKLFSSSSRSGGGGG